MIFFRLPHFCRPLLFIVAVFLFNCRCCCANDDASDLEMAHFACAKVGTQSHGFNVQQGGLISFDDEVNTKANGIFFGFKTNKGDGKLNIRMAVENSCVEKFEKRVDFQSSGHKCEKKLIDTKEECPKNMAGSCKMFDLSCAVSMKAVAGLPDAGVFKIRMKDLAKLKNVCKWQGSVNGVRLVLEDSKDPNGEPCAGGGLALWMLIAMIAGGVVGLLAVAAVVVFFVLKGRRPKDQKGGTSAAAAGTSFLSSFKSIFTSKKEEPMVKPNELGTMRPSDYAKSKATAMDGTKIMGLKTVKANDTAYFKTDGTATANTKTMGATSAANATTKTKGTTTANTKTMGATSAANATTKTKGTTTANTKTMGATSAAKPKEGGETYGII